MDKIDIYEELKRNPYPGRGIIIGKSADGEHAVIAYFIMGRSLNSRNRVFIEDGDGIRTKAFDESSLTDPSLVIYTPVRTLGDKTIVTNGDQTDTIYNLMSEGKTFEEALRTRKFEPDPPNYTPRISGIVNRTQTGFNYALSILKSADGDPASCQRYTFAYENPLSGTGHFIHTYKCNENPLLSFDGEPKLISIPDDMDEFTKELWHSLNEDNKISLFVRYIHTETGRTRTQIINKNK